MIAAILFFILAPQQAVPPQAEAEDVIVVRATKKHKCQMAIADRIIADAEFKARAAEWAAGKPVKVLMSPSADYKCLAKVMFRLNEHGVTRAVFDDLPAQ